MSGVLDEGNTEVRANGRTNEGDRAGRAMSEISAESPTATAGSRNAQRNEKDENNEKDLKNGERSEMMWAVSSGQGMG